MSLINKLFSILTVAVAVFAFSTFTLAQEDKAATPAPDKEKAEKHWKGEGRGMHKGEGKEFGHSHGGMMRMMHELNLTEAQKTQMHSIMEANKPDKATMEEMHTLAMAKHDGTITAEQQTRLDTLKEQAKAKAKSVHEQVQAILTPEQKAQIEQKKLEMKQRKEEHRQQREQRQKAPAATTPEVTKDN